MRTTTSSMIALGVALFAAPACDDVQEDIRAADGEPEAPVELRCGGDCGTINSPVAGQYVITNNSEGLGVPATNDAGTQRITSGQIVHDQKLRDITSLHITPTGVLRVTYTGPTNQSVLLSGKEVVGLKLSATFDPTVGDPYDYHLLVLEVNCWAMPQSPTQTMCKYLIGVDIDPQNAAIGQIIHPRVPSSESYWFACPGDDNENSLQGWDPWAVMFTDRIWIDTVDAPMLTLPNATGAFAMTCYPAAAAKIAHQWGVLAAPSVTQSRAAPSLAYSTAMLRAIMAWHDGASTTVQGMDYCLSDGPGGLLPECNQHWGLINSHVEALYDANGSVCTNQHGPADNGVHRVAWNANGSIAGWDEKPACASEQEAASIVANHGIGAHVVAGTYDEE